MLISTQSAIGPYAAKVGSRGQITIPQSVRESLSLNQGDILTAIQIGDAVVLTPKKLRTPALAEQFTQIMEEEGVTLADLLAGLAEEREILSRQHSSQYL